MQTQRHGLIRDGASLSGNLMYGVNEGRSQPIKSTTQLSKPIAARTSRRLMTYMDKYSEKSAPSDRKKTPLEAPNGTQGAQSGTE